MLKKNGVATARFKINLKLGQVAHTCCPHSWEVEVGASRVQSQPQLHCKFEARLAIWDPASKAKKKKKRKKMCVEAGVWIERTESLLFRVETPKLVLFTGRQCQGCWASVTGDLSWSKLEIEFNSTTYDKNISHQPLFPLFSHKPYLTKADL